MTVNDTDKFLVNRSGSSYHLEAQNLMAELQDDDLMLVNRSGKSYKATGAEIKGSLKPAATVIKPQIIAPKDGAGGTITPETDNIRVWDALSKELVVEGTKDLDLLEPGDRVRQNAFNEAVSGTVVQEPNDIQIAGGVTFEKFDQPFWDYNVQNATQFNYGRDPVTAVFNYHVENVGDKIYFLRGAHKEDDGSYTYQSVRIKEMYGDFVETRDEFVDQSDKASEVGWINPSISKFEVYALTATKTEGTISFVTQEYGGTAYLYFYGVSGASNLVMPTGTVGSISGTTITLSESIGDWSANTGNWVVGPTKTLSGTAPDPSGVNFVGSNFQSSDGSLDPGSADWLVIDKDGNIVSQVEKHPDMTDPQPKWTSGALEGETEYRARTKYYAASGEESPWSDDVTFKTANGDAPVTLPASDFVVWNGTTAIQAPVQHTAKFINAASNYTRLYGFDTEGQIIKIEESGLAEQIGDLAATLGDHVISQGLVGYNGSIGIIDNTGDLWFFDHTNYDPAPEKFINHLEGVQVSGGSSFSAQVDTAIAWSNEERKIYLGYPTSLAPNQFTFPTGATVIQKNLGWDDYTTEMQSRTFGLNIGKEIEFITGSGGNYWIINIMAVLFKDGKLFVNDTELLADKFVVQVFPLGKANVVIALTDDGELWRCNNDGSVALIGDGCASAACGYSSKQLAVLKTDNHWYISGVTEGSLTDSKINISNSGNSVSVKSLHSWGTSVNHSVAGPNSIVIPVL